MIDVGLAVIIAGMLIFAGVISIGVWAIRHQDQMFPDGFDRTGWNPDSERVSWFVTTWTWLRGGRG